jgi:hypothetical protein
MVDAEVKEKTHSSIKRKSPLPLRVHGISRFGEP